jgi:hypothetical protein
MDNKETLIEEKRIEKEASKYVIEPSNFAPQHISELLHKKFPKQEWIVDRLVPANAVTIFSAAPGSYKTRALLHLAISVAKGELLFDKFSTKQSGVLIVDEESGEPLLNKQLRQLGATDDLPIMYRSFQNFKLNDENIRLLQLDCMTYGLKVVIFDSLIQIHNAEENEATAMAPVMNHLKQLAEGGLSVLVIAHDRKTGQYGRKGSSELRGSSAILGGVDAHISFFVKKKTTLVIEPNKLRHGLPLQPFEVLVKGDDDSCSFEFQGEAKIGDNSIIKAAIVNALQEHEKLNQQDLLSTLNNSGTKVGENRLRDYLNDMVEAEELDWKQGVGRTKVYSLPV